MSATVLRAARSAPPATEVRVLPSLTVELHDATPTDAPVIAAIYNASLRSLPYQATPEGATQGAHWLASELRALGDSAQAPRGNHLGPWSVRMMAEWIAMHERAGRRLWLALVDGEPVGWLSFLGFCDRPGGAGTAEVAFYVAPRWHRRGVGRFMLEQALLTAPQWRIDRLMAFVWHDNAASLALLQRAGFREWGRLPGAIEAFGKRRDMVISGIELAERAANA